MRFPKPIYLVAAQRTPIGSFGGALAPLTASELGAQVISAVLKLSGIEKAKVEQVILGSVLTAGQGQAPARQALKKGGLPNETQALTVNKVCSSGLKAVLLACQEIALGNSEVVLAGGMESMSQAPYILPSLRNGARLGHAQAQDTIISDGLWDPYQNYHMGSAAELCARKYSISREDQDTFAIESYARAQEATRLGYFSKEIAPVTVKSGKAETVVSIDEEPGKLKLEKVRELKPAFEKDGTVTAANASSINDGAVGMLVCSEEALKKNNLTPLARVVAQGWNSREPEWFTVAPIGAIDRVLTSAELALGDVDLFEINEAFSTVALVCQRELKIAPANLNVSGGAVALGHPIGASGARILTTLIYNLHRLGHKRGIAAICNGGGEATSILVERV